MSELTSISLGDYIETLTDYHANGSYETLKKNVELKRFPDYAVMIRTLNFERPDFKIDLIYLNENEYNYLSKTKIYPDDILMNKIANPGSVYLMPDLEKPVSLAMNLFLIRFNNKVNQKFMFYLMKLNESYIKRFSNGTTTLTITKDSVRGLVFRIPQKRSQDKIAKTLSNIDKKIELNNKINTELEAMAKLIYDYWFVQFDFPNANNKPYKSSGGKMVYNEVLKREIPDGWEIGNVDEECTVRNGYAFKSESYIECGYTIVRAKNFKNGSVEFGDMVYISGDEAKSFERYNLAKFDFLLVMVGASVGKNVVVNSNILPALQNQNMWCFHSKRSVQLYVNQLLKRIVVEQLSTSSGSAREFFKKESFKKAFFVNPKLKNKKLYCERVEPMFNRIDILKIENQKLTELRDWLLPMLMNGQVTVHNTEKST